VVDDNGKAVFLTRYFKPIKPPDDLLNKGGTPEETEVSGLIKGSFCYFISEDIDNSSSMGQTGNYFW
jgi:hypothetical protein